MIIFIHKKVFRSSNHFESDGVYTFHNLKINNIDSTLTYGNEIKGNLFILHNHERPVNGKEKSKLTNIDVYLKKNSSITPLILSKSFVFH